MWTGRCQVGYFCTTFRTLYKSHVVHLMIKS
nr:MAG TPA: hypothetical protein [Caudoviricetes sp.]